MGTGFPIANPGVYCFEDGDTSNIDLELGCTPVELWEGVVLEICGKNAPGLSG